MKRITAGLILSCCSSLAVAYPAAMPLDKVVVQLSAKQWVKTETALVTVSINATLNNADLIKARSDIMNNLSKIANGEWHLTQFDRSQDSSGLEKLNVLAQARIPQASLSNLYQAAKDVSKPGAAYTIGDIAFKPSLEEVQQATGVLRERLYKQVNDELTRLNAVYTTQHYSVNRLYLYDAEVGAQPKVYAPQLNTMAMAATASAPLAVSNEIIMNAMAVLASNRQGSGTVAN